MVWQILTIIFGTVIAKIFADASNYHYDKAVDTTFKKIYGILQHVCELLMIAIPFCMGLIHNEYEVGLSAQQWLISVLSFACIYACLMSTGYNLLTGRHVLYIGLTDPIDILTRKVFKISNEFLPEYKDIPPKQKQKENFRKWIVFCIRFVLGFAGVEILRNFI